MKTVEQHIKEAWDEGRLWEFMGWDLVHGATNEQCNAFKVLFPALFDTH